MMLGTLDLDTRFEYLIIYKDKRDGTINTSTSGVAFSNHYKAMIHSDYVEILGVYKKLTDSQLEDIINK